MTGVIGSFGGPLACVLPSLLLGLVAVAFLTPAGGPTLGRGRRRILLARYAGSFLLAWLTQREVVH